MPIEIQVKSVSKRYKRDWVIEHISLLVNDGDRIAILGHNGSGKSTLLKTICGYVSQTEGEVVWLHDNKELEATQWHQYFTLSAPYLELVEEYTLQESIDLHFSLKSLRKDVNLDEVLQTAGLDKHLSKKVANFSSGMKQRLKLILTLCSDVPVYFLDEPCSNLDQAGVVWYQELIDRMPSEKAVLVASNAQEEYAFCKRELRVS